MAVNSTLPNGNPPAATTNTNPLVNATELYNLYNSYENANDQAVGGYNQGLQYLSSTANNVNNAFGDVYNQGVGQVQPYYDAGTAGIQPYLDLLEDPSLTNQTPGYDWRYNEGLRATERTFNQQGYGQSGNILTGLQEWGQGFAMDEYDRELQRRLDQIGLGQTAIGDMTDLGRNYTYGSSEFNSAVMPAIGDMYANRGQAQAFDPINQGESLNSLLQLLTGTSAAGGGSPFSSILSGGGFDNQGDYGFLGDIGGLVTGGYGDNYGTDWLNDPSNSQTLWDAAGGLDWASNNPTGDPFGPGSWFEGLNDPAAQGGGLWDGITNFGGDVWDTATGWLNDFFP